MDGFIEVNERIPEICEYDVIVSGGGVAGVAAAVSAARGGAKTLLVEKSLTLGGLATAGLVNFFVPMCNGRGKQIITGMAEEFLRLSIKYGYDTLPTEWANGEPQNPTLARYATKFSAPVFSLALAELLVKEDVTLLYDARVSDAVTVDGEITGLIIESKSGREFYRAKYIIDTTGDADILHRAGVPTTNGKNYFTYYGFAQSFETLRRALENDDISASYEWVMGGRADLYGGGQREGERLYEGTSVTDVTEYVLKNQLLALDEVKKHDRRRYDVIALPTMPQMRTTRRIKGEYTLTTADCYRHHADSIGAICDFDNRDHLYEVPFRTLYNANWKNVLTAGRSASAEGYAWDVLRVIPPAILTGQAAGTAAAIAVKDGKTVAELDINKLRTHLERDGVTLSFDDALVPEKENPDTKTNSGHF